MVNGSEYFRDLDIRIGEEVYNREVRTLDGLPFYSTNPAAAYDVEERIAELGLQKEYEVALGSILTQNAMLWDYVHAPPDQRCLAALEVMARKTMAARG